MYTFSSLWDVGIVITVWHDLTYVLTCLIVSCWYRTRIYVPPELGPRSGSQGSPHVWCACDKWMYEVVEGKGRVLLNTEFILSPPAFAAHPWLCCQGHILKGVGCWWLVCRHHHRGALQHLKRREPHLSVGLCPGFRQVKWNVVPELFHCSREWTTSCQFDLSSRPPSELTALHGF